MKPPEERSGSMVLRAWLEGGKPQALRVRVIFTVGTNDARSLVVSSPEAVHTAVQNWLEELGTGTMTFS
ncbi:hypothetical protein ACIQUM_19715 [Amycolatopsis azurea]|uniref:hypothetical protein n=1 Tax=Amycolatopsis azurea TaxID=36819 RepID=UPI00381A226E